MQGLEIYALKVGTLGILPSITIGISIFPPAKGMRNL